MDLPAALESMAQCSIGSLDDYMVPTSSDRWTIETQLNNFTRDIVSDEQWALLSGTSETEGHDKESSTYHISLLSKAKSKKKQLEKKPARGAQKEYLVKLEHPLDTAEKIRIAANLPQAPEIKIDDECTTTFAVDQYPVPYFFYGTLADAPTLTRLLGLEQEPHFELATICRGKLKTWGGKYNALVDGMENDTMNGWLYGVESKEHEDALRHYEGSNYEVPRCEILVGDGKEAVKGLTFRFCGDEELLR
ncbi:hypothetical protein K458DRAFT_458528 [Lentithecium fluviatile CBS 122367]|uniref:Putative gamma-glutamylcyclotransferase n=1 Tax=Lentithecium fluviatile CBS 122367 TaxID=1168545 RepID=A0A6G1IPU9_9PLEO|nr:hypothetical protein K458DRAFT_458528 [Lentithecium fluviatile CBS 122367]